MELCRIEEHRSRKALDSAALHRGYFLISLAQVKNTALSLKQAINPQIYGGSPFGRSALRINY